jgi:hypothetical protein
MRAVTLALGALVVAASTVSEQTAPVVIKAHAGATQRSSLTASSTAVNNRWTQS